jgi:hypothetical protein
MPADRTLVTELATGLGMVCDGGVEAALAERPAQLSNVDDRSWLRLGALWSSGDFFTEFVVGYANGRAFLQAPDALAGRRPRIVEWTGGRRPPGDEVVPSDLRIDHVYLVSCKYLSRILHNPSPGRLIEGLLAQGPVDDPRDWYERVAPAQYQRLYEQCRSAVPGAPLPEAAAELKPDERRRLAATLSAGWPEGGPEAYAELGHAVSKATAERWQASLTTRNAEEMLWRILRIGSAPYFILGADRRGSMRLRIDTPWDWRRRYRLRRFTVEPQPGGQPRVGWVAWYQVRHTLEPRLVRGHVELRWSHGRFAQPPEAKVYLDSAHHEVPGYHPI